MPWGNHWLTVDSILVTPVENVQIRVLVVKHEFHGCGIYLEIQGMEQRHSTAIPVFMSICYDAMQSTLQVGELNPFLMKIHLVSKCANTPYQVLSS